MKKEGGEGKKRIKKRRGRGSKGEKKKEKIWKEKMGNRRETGKDKGKHPTPEGAFLHSSADFFVL